MDFLEKILVEKRKEVAQMPLEEVTNHTQGASFYQTVRNHPERIHVIGEIKRASPSKGAINLEVDILDQAQQYQAAGVSAISVLTDEVFFKGQLQDLADIAATVSVPVLCKDFVISEKQLIRAKNAGASLVLLIVAALSREELQTLYTKAQALQLEVLVEAHNAEELQTAKDIGAKIIGINNRDLKTFIVDIDHSVQLTQPQEDIVYVSESGFATAEDVQRITKGFHAVLVGETLMRATSPREKIAELRVKRHG
jgi:Indole-3-glycerol phosphate synthase